MVPWVPVLVGTGVLAGYVIYAIALNSTDPADATPQATVQAQGPPVPSPAQDTTSPPGGRGTDPPAPGVHPVQSSPTPSPTPTASPTPSPEPAGGEVVGEYELLHTFRSGFIGELLLANTGDRPGDWTVELEFGRDVERLRDFWVDGSAQPTVERVRDRYVFTGTGPVEPESWVMLRVQFDRDGRDIAPTVCTVNGAACAVRD